MARFDADRVLAAIMVLTVELGRPPTYHELAGRIESVRSHARLLCHELRDRGLLRHDRRIALGDNAMKGLAAILLSPALDPLEARCMLMARSLIESKEHHHG